jgi:hypothetical protein
MDLHPDKNGTSNSQSDGLNNNNGGNGVVEDGWKSARINKTKQFRGY